ACWAFLMALTVFLSVFGTRSTTLYLGSWPSMFENGSNRWTYERRTLPVTTLVVWFVVTIGVKLRSVCRVVSWFGSQVGACVPTLPRRGGGVGQLWIYSVRASNSDRAWPLGSIAGRRSSSGTSEGLPSVLVRKGPTSSSKRFLPPTSFWRSPIPFILRVVN